MATDSPWRCGGSPPEERRGELGARATGAPVVFWLDEQRAHDAQILAKVREYLPELGADDVTVDVIAPGRGHRGQMRFNAVAGADVARTADPASEVVNDSSNRAATGKFARAAAVARRTAG